MTSTNFLQNAAKKMMHCVKSHLYSLCIKVRRQKSGIDTTKYHTWPRTPHGKVTKTQKKNITYKRAKRPALSQLMTTRLQWTDKKAVYTSEYWSKINPTVKPVWAWLQTQHQALNLSSIDKSLNQNRHRIWGHTCRRAIKEVYEVANRDYVDHQACSLLQFINVITNLLIMRNYFNLLQWKIIKANNFFLIYTLSLHKNLVPKALGAREIKPNFTYFSFHNRFSNTFSPFLHYQMDARINISNIWILIFKKEVGSGYLYFQELIICRLGTSR